MKKIQRIFELAALGAVLVATMAPAAPAGTAAALQKIYARAADEAYSRHTVIEKDGTTFVSTGDIRQEWLRDSSAVLVAYLPTAARDPYVQSTLRGAIARQARYILLDGYANAFTDDYRVAERKYEMDSLLYPLLLASRYWGTTGDRSIFTPELQRAIGQALSILRTEQRHTTRSHYTNPGLMGGNGGTPVAYTGLIWTGFRPSDDPAQFQYNIPDNMFAVVVLRDVSRIERNVYHDDKLANEAWGLSVQVNAAISRYGTVFVPGYGLIYAYEVDGFGHANLMDDANVPSLLSIPYFGYAPRTNSLYEATRRFILSSKDPYFYQGTFASGIGSSHTPRGYVWPLSLLMQAFTANDNAEVHRVMGYVANSDPGDHLLHESFDASNPHHYTRADFAWPNAVFDELMVSL
jgi:meiotically up-regulated gene 157 (Mug157) protein